MMQHYSDLLIAIISSALTAGFLVYFSMNIRVLKLREKLSKAELTLELERQATEEKITAAENARLQLSETFNALSSQALQHNSEQFLKLAQENLKQFQINAKNDLDKKEKNIENLIAPIKETLQKTEKQILEIEKERKEAYGALKSHLQSMTQTQEALYGETKNLVKALSRPEVRGQWGELTLKRLVELAGMVEHCDFIEQAHNTTDEKIQRPDMIVRMPGGRELIIDVKTPLDAYLKAVEAPDESTRNGELMKHTRNVKERVKELANKAYWNQFKKSPEFVVLFIPGDQFLSAALEGDHSLLEYALQQKVILATPTSLVALLRAIAYGWRQESLAENAENIRKVGDELYGRLATFAEHLAKLGKGLNGAVQSYNKVVGSYDTRILPSIRKFSDMGITSNKSVDPLEQIETSTRSIENIADIESN